MNQMVSFILTYNVKNGNRGVAKDWHQKIYVFLVVFYNKNFLSEKEHIIMVYHFKGKIKPNLMIH